jgi:hypothetical protein
MKSVPNEKPRRPGGQQGFETGAVNWISGAGRYSTLAPIGRQIKLPPLTAQSLLSNTFAVASLPLQNVRDRRRPQLRRSRRPKKRKAGQYFKPAPSPRNPARSVNLTGGSNYIINR